MHKIIKVLAALFSLSLLPVTEHSNEQKPMYEFVVEKEQDHIWGTSLIRNVFEEYWAEDYLENTVLFYGRLQTLFGEPLYETENLENQYSYCVSTVTEEGKTIYLSVYSGSTGPAIGGQQDKESKKAADALVEMILEAEPADYEYAGYYLGDVAFEINWEVKDGVVHAEDRELDLPEEEFIELFDRLFGLETTETEDEAVEEK